MISYYRLTHYLKDKIDSESKLRYPLETGGILVGYFDMDTAIISHISDAGPKSIHERSRFKRDGVYTQNFLDSIVVSSNGNSDYVGEWHSHPENHGPSQKDIRAMRWISENPAYHICNPILGLYIRSPISWQLQFYIFCDGRLKKLRETPE